MATRRSHRLIATAVLIAMSGILAGCASSSSFDPTDMFDVFDTKKKLPGNREPVFPEGVPGLEQGVPKELYKENVDRQQLQQQQAAPVEAAPPPAAEPPKHRSSSRSRATKRRAAEPAREDAAAPEQQQEATTPPPAPKPAKRTVRHRSTTVPPPDTETPAPQAQPQAAPPAASGSSFPAPLPSGSFQRQ